MKRILMIATGGTIASKNTGAGFAPALSSQELLSCVPEIAEICRVQTMQPFNLDSTNVYHKHWLQIARIIEDRYEEFDGFVITHGTDTMAYTAAALSYLVQSSAKPIVFTGSQKSVYLRDTDARRNLLDAFTYCCDDSASGVHVVFDGNVILGTRAKKTRTHSYNAFSSVDFPEVAILRDGKVVYYIKEDKPAGAPRFYHNLDPDVFVLKMTPGMSPAIFDYLSLHCDGLILETFGSGGLPSYDNDEFFAYLKQFLKNGKTVVVTTQVEREGSSLARYEVGRKVLDCGNVLEARCMTLEAALSKLMWTLAQSKENDRVEQLFLAPVQSDIL